MAGSLVVGLLLLSWIGTTGALRVIGGLGLVFAAVGIAAYGPLRSFLSLAAALVGVIVLLPSQEGLWLRLHGRVAGVDRALVEEDATAVVAITPERRGQWWVWMGGRTQSSLPFGGVHSQLGAVPAVVHPAPLDLAIIGLGSGDTAWAAGCRRETRSVTVFEIQAPQHRLLTALSADGRMRRLESFLRDPRMNLVHEDGRNVLGREDKLYDLIEADALLPDFAYSGSVYSVEFFRLAASKLKPGGVMCTWAPTHRVVASFSRVFPHVVAFRNARLLVGSNERLPVDIATWNARVAAPEVRRYLGGEIAASVLKVLQRAQALMPEDVPDVEPNEDLFPRDEFLSP
jgi:spermidine synthase